MNRFTKKAAAAVMSLAMLASASAAVSTGIVKTTPAITASAASVLYSTNRNGVKYDIYDTYARVAWVDWDATEVTILETVDGKKVTGMDSIAFLNRTKITKVNMINAKGITKIPFAAFSGCINLRKIILPPSIKQIEYHAFQTCISLKEIRLPYSVETIASEAFTWCPALETVIFNRINTSIESDSFPANCTAMFYTPKNGNLFATYIYQQLAAQEYNITTYKLGDVTGDNKITTFDKTKAQQAVNNILSGQSSGLSKKQTIAADANGDGEITSTDVSYIQAYINAANAGYPFGMEAWMSGKLNGTL